MEGGLVKKESSAAGEIINNSGGWTGKAGKRKGWPLLAFTRCPLKVDLDVDLGHPSSSMWGTPAVCAPALQFIEGCKANGLQGPAVALSVGLSTTTEAAWY